MFGIGKRVWKFYCVVPCLLLLGAFSGCSFAYAAPTAEQSAIIAEQTKLIEANPKDYKAYFRRGRAYFDAAQYSEADADCKSGLRINPNSQHLWVLQANVACKSKDYSRSLGAIRRAQAIGPNNSVLCGMEVSCLSSLDKDSECLKRCRELISLYPMNACFYYFRAVSAEKLRLPPPQILADYREAARLGPAFPDYETAFLRYSRKSGTP